MKTIKTIDCVVANNLLSAASLGSMAASDKFAVIKTIKAIKPIVKAFEEFRDDAAEKLKGENHAEMQAKANEWREKGDKCTFSDAEKIAINAYFDNYASEMNACIDEEVNKINDVDIRTISEDSFGCLLEANSNWSVEQILKIEEIMCN